MAFASLCDRAGTGAVASFAAGGAEGGWPVSLTGMGSAGLVRD